MSFFTFFKRRPESSDPRPTPIEILRILIPGYISPRGREEIRQMKIGNPAERQIQRQTLARVETLYARGCPVAGHNEPVPINNPRLRRRPPFVP
jgi:hypothetical protein